MPNLLVTKLEGDVSDTPQTVATGSATLRVGQIPQDAKFVFVDGHLYSDLGKPGSYTDFGNGKSIYNVSVLLDPNKGLANVVSKLQGASVAGTEQVNGVATTKITGNSSADDIATLAGHKLTAKTSRRCRPRRGSLRTGLLIWSRSRSIPPPILGDPHDVRLGQAGHGHQTVNAVGCIRVRKGITNDDEHLSAALRGGHRGDDHSRCDNRRAGPAAGADGRWGAIAYTSVRLVGAFAELPDRGGGAANRAQLCGYSDCQVLVTFTACGAVAANGFVRAGGYGNNLDAAMQDALNKVGGGWIDSWACN